MEKGDGIPQSWQGHAVFTDAEGRELSVRHLPNFFESFPVVLADQDGIICADIPFRRAESKYSFEQTGAQVSLYGGDLNGQTFTDPAVVKGFAREPQDGEIFKFDRGTFNSDGVFR